MNFQSVCLLLFCLFLDFSIGWRLWTNETASVDSLDGTVPNGRRGHSLVMYKDYVLLFGGRGRDINRFHLPKTFELVSERGKLEFASYDEYAVPKGSREDISLVEGDKFVDECLADLEEAKNKTECKYNPENMSEEEKERWNKENYVPSTEYFNDIWFYNLGCRRYADGPCEEEGWQLIDAGARLGGCHLEDGVDVCTHPHERYGHSAHVVNDEFLLVFGGYSHFCGDYCDDAWIYYFWQPGEPPVSTTNARRWVQLEIATSVGKRWKFSSVLIDSSQIFLFGGHRLWHGFSDDNDRSNRYSSYEEIPKGGYLSDLWKLDLSSCVQGLQVRAEKSFDENIEFYSNCIINWEEIGRKQNCTSRSLLKDGQLKPGFRYEDRFQEICFTIWPPARSSHTMVYYNNSILLHGGYRTFFPYPHSSGAGSNKGTSSQEVLAWYRPYPTYNYYLDDLWKYDLKSGYWEQVQFKSKVNPSPRMEHSLIQVEDMLILYGGYQANHHLDELWYFNLTTLKWLEKKSFVHPKYPENCTEGEIVKGIPTKGTLLDGKFGRRSKHLFVNITRRQSPGWDGCRDRADERRDMPWDLQWEKPTQRSNQAITFAPKFGLLLMFGGHGNTKEHLKQTSFTFPVDLKGDFWEYRIHQCINNCSNHGDCSFGFCRCHSGYYGMDCSNTSCPGDFCYYDEDTMEQVCQHCCHAPYVHTDNDVYVNDLGKLSCSKENPGRSNGICDGYGKCHCAPPFIGLDCAIKDCPKNCSGNGWCSEEYPVSRCMCNPGFTGEDCSFKECLNNCSYPNGVCEDGVCNCMMWPDPYNRTRNWRRFEGMDCSWLIPYAKSSKLNSPILFTIFIMILFNYKTYYKL